MTEATGSDVPDRHTNGADRHPNPLERLRESGRRLLAAARGGDAPVIAWLRSVLPRLASLDDAHLRETIKLADVQHVLARTLDFASWGELKACYAPDAALHDQARQFLDACRHEQAQRAASLLASEPRLAAYSIHTAAAAGDLAALTAWLTADRSSATRPDPLHGIEPLLYAVVPEPKRERGVPESEQAELVQRLLDAGADANATIPLEGGASRIPALYFPAVSNNLPVARVLLAAGADPNDGESVYHAAQHNHRDMLAQLLEHGADPSGRDATHGNTPLYFLASHRADNPITASCILGMEWLLEHGADPNVISHIAPSSRPVPAGGETPLQRAAASGLDAGVMQLLVDHGAELDAPRADGRTAYAMAVRSGNLSAADFLADAGAMTAPLAVIDRVLGACVAGEANAARALLDANPDTLSSLTDEDRAVLGTVVTEGRLDAVALMVDLGFPLDHEGEWGGTPLHWAAWNGLAPMVAMLIACGAPINIRDSMYGSSPIAWAAHGSTYCAPRPGADHVAVVKALLDAGARREESVNQWGEPPESMAREDVAQLLRDRGFVPDRD